MLLQCYCSLLIAENNCALVATHIKILARECRQPDACTIEFAHRWSHMFGALEAWHFAQDPSPKDALTFMESAVSATPAETSLRTIQKMTSGESVPLTDKLEA